MHEKLLKIQSELKVPKNQVNAFGKYKYRSCEDIIEAVKPLVHREGLTLILTDEVVVVGGSSVSTVTAPRFYVKATARLGDSKSYLDAVAYAREEETKKGMDGAQITGSASSYARKYALNGLFAIDDTADPDATNDHGKEKVAYPEPLKDSDGEIGIPF